MNYILTVDNVQVKRDGKVNLEIQQKIVLAPKDKVAILGENGAGKTTLINVILGEVDFEGKTIKHFSKEDCGIVFQENAYNPLLKVYELVELALPLTKSELGQFLKKYELEDLKNKHIKNLSGGEEQRLTLSLVLEKNQPVYFFDELTSGLDYKKRLALLALMKEKTINSTVFNVTHYFEEIENWATKILMLKEGKLVFFGTVADFFAQFGHHSVLKLEYAEYSKLDETDLPQDTHSDTGDGRAFVCGTKQDQVRLETFFDKKNMTYKIIKQNMYTTYLVADTRMQMTDTKEIRHD